MSDLEKIPTAAFDASKHVISGREQGTGKQVWFTLESVSQAERVYEGDGPAQDLKGYVTKDELALFRDVMVKAVSDHVPSQQLPQETVVALASMAEQVLRQKKDIEDLKSALSDLTHNFALIKDKWRAIAGT